MNKDKEVKLVPFFGKIGADGKAEPPAIRFYVRTGQMAFNKDAVTLLGLEQGFNIGFFKDENDPKGWYVRASLDYDIKIKSKHEGSLTAFSVHVTRALAKSMGLKKVKAFSVNLAPKPIEGGFHALLTVAPHKILEEKES